MKEILKLTKPILIEGRNVTELEYDIDEITPALFAEAEAMKNKYTGTSRFSGGASGAAELDYAFHLYLGAAAAIAVNPMLTFEDLMQVRGKDTYSLMKVGRSFMTASVDSTEDSSEEQSETIAEFSMTQAMNSEDEVSEDF